MSNNKIIKNSPKNNNFDKLLDQELIFAASEAIISERKQKIPLLEQSLNENLFRNKENQLNFINRIIKNPESIKEGDDEAINNILLKPIFEYLAQNYSDWVNSNVELKKLFTNEELNSTPIKGLEISNKNHAFVHIFDIERQGWFFDRESGDKKQSPSVPKVNKSERSLFNKFSALASSIALSGGASGLSAVDNSLRRLEKISMIMMVEKRRRDREKPQVAGFKTEKDFQKYQRQSAARAWDIRKQELLQDIPNFFSGMAGISKKIAKKVFLEFDDASKSAMGSAASQIVFANFARFPELKKHEDSITMKKAISLASFVDKQKIAELEQSLKKALQKPNVGDSQFERHVPSEESTSEQYGVAEIIRISKQVLSNQLVSPDGEKLSDWYFSEENNYLISKVKEAYENQGIDALIKKLPILMLKTADRSGVSRYNDLYEMSYELLNKANAKQKHALLMYLAKKDFDESTWGKFFNFADKVGLIIAGITIFIAPLLLPAEVAAIEAGKRVAFQKLREKIVEKLGKELSEKILYTIGVVDFAEIAAQGFRATYVINTEELEKLGKVIDAISKVKASLPSAENMRELVTEEAIDESGIISNIDKAEKVIDNLTKMTIEAAKDTKIAEIIIKNSSVGPNINFGKAESTDPIVLSFKKLKDYLKEIKNPETPNLQKQENIINFVTEWNRVTSYIESYTSHYEKLGQEFRKHEIWMPEKALQNENLLREKREKKKKIKKLSPAQKQHHAKLAYSEEHRRFAVRNFWTRGATAEDYQFPHKVIHQNLTNLEKEIEKIETSLGMAPKSLFVSSGFRDLEKNKKVKSKPTSQHRLGKAADLYPGGRGGLTALKLYARIINLINMGKLHNGGVGIYKNFVHYDIRNKPSRWYRDEYRALRGKNQKIKDAIAEDLESLKKMSKEDAKTEAEQYQNAENKIKADDAELEDSKEIAQDAVFVSPAEMKKIPKQTANIDKKDTKCAQDYYSIEKMRAGIVHVFKGGKPCNLNEDYRYRIPKVFSILKRSISGGSDYSFAFGQYNELSTYAKKRVWRKVSKLLKNQQNWMFNQKKDRKASMEYVLKIENKIKSNLLYSVSNYLVDINLGSMLGRRSLTDTVCITYMKTSKDKFCPIIFLSPSTENFPISTWYQNALKDGFGVINPEKNHDRMLLSSRKSVKFVNDNLKRIKSNFEELVKIHNLNQGGSFSKTREFTEVLNTTKRCVAIIDNFSKALDAFLNGPNHRTLTQVIKTGFVLSLITRSYYT